MHTVISFKEKFCACGDGAGNLVREPILSMLTTVSKEHELLPDPPDADLGLATMVMVLFGF
jgi:hypothetical protein